ncbi:MAG: lytic murein transglycosylase, partial [Sphingomonadales bacterium]
MLSSVRVALAAIGWMAAATGSTIAIAQTTIAEEGQSSDDAARIADVAVPPPPTESSQMRGFLASLRPRAIALGVTGALFDATLPTLNYNARVVRLDRAQPGATPQSVANPPA